MTKFASMFLLLMMLPTAIFAQSVVKQTKTIDDFTSNPFDTTHLLRSLPGEPQRLGLPRLPTSWTNDIRVQMHANAIQSYQPFIDPPYVSTAHRTNLEFADIGNFLIAEAFPKWTNKTGTWPVGTKFLLDAPTGQYQAISIAPGSCNAGVWTGLEIVKTEDITNMGGPGGTAQTGTRITFYLPGTGLNAEYGTGRCPQLGPNPALGANDVNIEFFSNINGWASPGNKNTQNIKLSPNATQRHPVEYHENGFGGTLVIASSFLAGDHLESSGYHLNVDTGVYTKLKDCATPAPGGGLVQCKVQNASGTYNYLIMYTSNMGQIHSHPVSTLYQQYRTRFYSASYNPASPNPNYVADIDADYLGSAGPGVSQWNFKMNLKMKNMAIAGGGFDGGNIAWDLNVYGNYESPNWSGQMAFTQ